VRRLLVGYIAVVQCVGYVGHSRDNVVHAIDWRQLHVKCSTGALWYEPVKEILKASNIPALSKLNVFAGQRLALILEEFFEQPSELVFRSRWSTRIALFERAAALVNALAARRTRP